MGSITELNVQMYVNAVLLGGEGMTGDGNTGICVAAFSILIN